MSDRGANRAVQSLYFTGPSRLEWRDEPTPVLTDSRHALVRPLAGAACDFDTKLVAVGDT
jgi:hypothetical protein